MKPVGKILNMLHVVIGHSAFTLFTINHLEYHQNKIKSNSKCYIAKAFNTLTKANVFMAEFYATDRIVSILKHDFVVEKRYMLSII